MQGTRGHDDAQAEQLIELVTERVRERLEPGARPLQDTSRNQAQHRAAACDKKGLPDCDACRGCHVHRPDDVRTIVRGGASRIAAGLGNEAPATDIAARIDHTLLAPDATREQLRELCAEARRYGFATVCVNPVNVRYCATLLQETSVKPIAVVGFPLGASTPNAKAFETREAVRNGAQEIDMVINIGALKSKDYATVLEDIRAVVDAAAPKAVKTILETARLSDDEKVIACSLAKVAGAAFVKTSTGFGPGGATEADIALMRRIVGDTMGVKASGGVRDTRSATAMLEAGANRLGASASVAIVTGDSKSQKLKKRAAGGY